MIWEMFRLFRTLTQPEDYRDCQVALSNSSISQLQQEFTNLQEKSLETQVKLTQCSSPWECRHPEQAQISQRELLALRICKIRQTQIQKTEQHQTNQDPKTEISFTEIEDLQSRGMFRTKRLPLFCSLRFLGGLLPRPPPPPPPP